MEKQKQASQSTNYRYKKSNRSKQLSSFCQFRNQYQYCISQSKIQQVKSVFQHGICGKNQTGHLVVVDRVGAIKMNQINKILDQDDIVGYFNQRLLHISQKIIAQKQQILWVIDLHGKIMQLASKKTLSILSKIIKNAQTYFPDILYKMYLTNTPMLFDTIWGKFCDQISQETQQKIIMLSDQLDPLYQQVDLAMLPEFLGGQLSQQMFLRDCVECVDDNKQNQLCQNQKHQEQQESEEQQQFDFASLKQALSGMKMGGLKSVNQTPLNTQADDN